MMHNDANNYSLRLMEKKSCSIGTYSSSSSSSSSSTKTLLSKEFLDFSPQTTPQSLVLRRAGKNILGERCMYSISPKMDQKS